MPPKRASSRTAQQHRGSTKRRTTTTTTTRGRGKRTGKTVLDQPQIRQNYRPTIPKRALQEDATDDKSKRAATTGYSYITATQDSHVPVPLSDSDIKQLDQTVANAWSSDMHMPRMIVHNDKEKVTSAERLLRQFDLDLSYGPCIGISRAQRWQRAMRHSLHPPAYLGDLLDVKAMEWRKLRGVQENANIDRPI
ncbi:DNA polymerase delta, subunit 4-domain-containing protein [Syncephalis plumigaleata]|nr:DNA polymerase delta, subunit 4-domain-containing protein [Syncephalis plumigaleata]